LSGDSAHITTLVAPSRLRLRHHDSSCATATPAVPSRLRWCRHNFSAPSRLQMRHHNFGCAFTTPVVHHNSIAPPQLQLRHHDSSGAVQLQLCHHDSRCHHDSGCAVTIPVAPSRLQLRHHDSSCATSGATAVRGRLAARRGDKGSVAAQARSGRGGGQSRQRLRTLAVRETVLWAR
jgi:hypothetical protein